MCWSTCLCFQMVLFWNQAHLAGLEVTLPRDACWTQQNDKEKCGSVLGAKIIMLVNRNIKRNVVVFWVCFQFAEKCGSVLGAEIFNTSWVWAATDWEQNRVSSSAAGRSGRAIYVTSHCIILLLLGTFPSETELYLGLLPWPWPFALAFCLGLGLGVLSWPSSARVHAFGQRVRTPA